MKINAAALSAALSKTASVDAKKFIVPAQHYTKR